MNYVEVFPQLRNIAQIVRRCPTQTLRSAYVQALRDWCNQTHWLRKDITTAAVFDSGAEGAYLVPLAGQDATYLEVVAIRGDIKGIDTAHNNGEFKVSPADPTGWNLAIDPGTPQRYAYRPHAHFDLHPTPDREYSYRITAVLQPKDNVLFVPEAPLLKWSTVIEAGALAYLFTIPKQPWTDAREATAQMKIFQAGINNGKADAQRSHNTGSQRVAARRFVRR